MNSINQKIALRLLALSLCLALLLTLPSCIRAKEEPGASTVAAATTVATTAATAPPPPVDFSDPEALSAAFLKGGVVDCSDRKYAYSEMCQDLIELQALYPTRFSYESFGKSVAGRELYVCRLGDPNASRQVLVSAGLHGREYLTPILVMKQMEFMLYYESAGSFDGVNYSRMMDDICYYVVPMSNPDGIMLSQEGIGSIQDPALRDKIYSIYYSDFQAGLTGQDTVNGYLQYWKANANGVDLNRNFDALWEQYYNYSKPSFAQYKGPSPASEPETQALVRLTDSLTNLLAVLCIHSQGEVLYWDCGQTETLREDTRALTQAISALNGYRPVNDVNNDASYSDWCALERNLIAITVETGSGLCPLDTEKFPPIWQDNYDLLAMVGAYFLE